MKKIKATVTHTINLGDFESCKIEVSAETEVKGTDTLTDALEDLNIELNKALATSELQTISDICNRKGVAVPNWINKQIMGI